MQRTQISLGEEERRLLDEEAARTGRSISALVRAAVTAVYGPEHSVEADLRALEQAFGGWADDDRGGESYVESVRSGRRLRGRR